MRPFKSKFERITDRTIAQQRAKARAYETLKKEGLPIPPDLKAEVEGTTPIIGFG